MQCGYMMDVINKIFVGDCREVLKGFPEGVVNTTVTSPPYYNLRDYGNENQIGIGIRNNNPASKY